MTDEEKRQEVINKLACWFCGVPDVLCDRKPIKNSVICDQHLMKARGFINGTPAIGIISDDQTKTPCPYPADQPEKQAAWELAQTTMINDGFNTKTIPIGGKK